MTGGSLRTGVGDGCCARAFGQGRKGSITISAQGVRNANPACFPTLSACLRPNSTGGEAGYSYIFYPSRIFSTAYCENFGVAGLEML